MNRKIVLVCAAMFGCGVAFAQGNAPTAVNWKAMLPAVQEAAKKEFADAGGYYPVSISRTADVTGEGTSEALIDFGCCGAYADEMTVMRIEDGKPVVALFRGKDGKVSTMVFLEGASVMHGASVQMIPAEHAVFWWCWDMNSDGTKVAACGGSAYRWDAAAKRFDFNGPLSKRLTRDFCQKTRAELTSR